MLKDSIEKNNSTNVNSREVEKLQKVLPQYFDKDGNFKLEEFKNMLSTEEVDLNKEGYGLDFLGKSYAKYESALETETVLTPDVEHNIKDINKESENLYIIGDNIDGLKHLLKSYSNKIKSIYIDPPYNTGSDGFVYPDNFSFNSKELSKTIGIEEEEAKRILNLAGRSTHSAWLTFMYPRLLLARDLLKDDGAIFISIDDNELANLKLICDEIFGEENFVGCITRATGTTTGQDGVKIGSSLDYVVVYAKSDSFELKGVPLTDEDLKRFNKKDEKGAYSTLQLRKTGNEDRKEDRENMFYAVEAPDGALVYPFGPNNSYLSRWRWAKSTYDEAIENDLIVWETDESLEGTEIDGYTSSKWKPYVKYYAKDRTKQLSNLLTNIDGNKKGSNEVKELFDGNNLFSNPKPTELIDTILSASTDDYSNDIILDFFSGSATTAHSVMNQNAINNGNRKFIMIQIPEKLPEKSLAFKKNFNTIDDIGRERIRKAAEKIKKELDADIDYGYKTYVINEVPKNTLKKLEDFDPAENTTLMSMDFSTEAYTFSETNGSETILTTLLNDDGYGLGVNVEVYMLDSYETMIKDNSIYIIDEGLTSDDVMALVRDIENSKLNISRVVVYAHSISFTVLHELRNNLKNLKNSKTVHLIEEY